MTPVILRKGVSFYYIPRCQNTPPRVIHIDISQKTAIWSLELENIKGIGKELIESENVGNISITPAILRNGSFILPCYTVFITKHTNNNQKSPNWFLQLENIKNLW